MLRTIHMLPFHLHKPSLERCRHCLRFTDEETEAGKVSTIKSSGEEGVYSEVIIRISCKLNHSVVFWPLAK